MFVGVERDGTTGSVLEKCFICKRSQRITRGGQLRLPGVLRVNLRADGRCQLILLALRELLSFLERVFERLGHYRFRFHSRPFLQPGQHRHPSARSVPRRRDSPGPIRGSAAREKAGTEGLPVPYDSHLVQPLGTAPLPATARRRAAQLLRRLAVLWQRPGLERVQVVMRPRLRRTLGRFSRRTRQIELSPAVLSGATLTEVLTHEAAHAALATATAKPVRPHGPEWQRLMTVAGSPDAKATRWCRRAKRDKTTRTNRTQPSAGTQPQPKPPTLYDHWCPVCHASRPAKKPVPAWRCAACVAAGLQGRLEITPRASKRQEPKDQGPPGQNPQP